MFAALKKNVHSLFAQQNIIVNGGDWLDEVASKYTKCDWLLEVLFSLISSITIHQFLMAVARVTSEKCNGKCNRHLATIGAQAAFDQSEEDLDTIYRLSTTCQHQVGGALFVLKN